MLGRDEIRAALSARELTRAHPVHPQPVTAQLLIS